MDAGSCSHGEASKRVLRPRTVLALCLLTALVTTVGRSSPASGAVPEPPPVRRLRHPACNRQRPLENWRGPHEVLVRAAEIVLDRQTALAAAMTGPEVLIEPELGDITLRDFDRLDKAVAAGRRAAEAALPELHHLLKVPPRVPATAARVLQLRFDPVCAMVISPARARATAVRGETTYYLCSPNCRDCFERDPHRYLAKAGWAFGGPWRSGQTGSGGVACLQRVL